MINIILVDDHKIVREGIKSLIDSVDDIKVIAEGSDGIEAVDLTLKHSPDVLIIDVRMPNCNGLEAIREIREKKINTAILVLSMHDDEQYIEEAFHRGAEGYILKDTGKEELVKAINNVYNGKRYYSGDVSNTLLKQLKPKSQNQTNTNTSDLNENIKPITTDYSQLTKREKQILELLYKGKNNKEISTLLGKSIRTIETHRFNIMKKMSATNIVDLIKKVENTPLVLE